MITYERTIDIIQGSKIIPSLNLANSIFVDFIDIRSFKSWTAFIVGDSGSGIH